MKKPFRLPRKFAEKWLRALRSGKYEQATGQLVYENRYCCLGVAGRICGLTDEDLALHGGTFYSDEKRIPKEIAGAHAEGFVPFCTQMNDEQLLSFSQIADEIRKNTVFYK